MILLFPPAVLAVISNDAVPGQPTYPIKRILEAGFLAIVSVNPNLKAQFTIKRTERRYDESIHLIEAGDSSQNVSNSLGELVRHTREAAKEVAKIENAQEKQQKSVELKQSIKKYQQGLIAEQQKIEARPGYQTPSGQPNPTSIPGQPYQTPSYQTPSPTTVITPSPTTIQIGPTTTPVPTGTRVTPSPTVRPTPTTVRLQPTLVPTPTPLPNHGAVDCDHPNPIEAAGCLEPFLQDTAASDRRPVPTLTVTPRPTLVPTAVPTVAVVPSPTVVPLPTAIPSPTSTCKASGTECSSNYDCGGCGLRCVFGATRTKRCV